MLVEIQKGNTVKQAAKKLGFDWSIVDRSLSSLNFRAYIVQLATLAGGERRTKVVELHPQPTKRGESLC